MKAKIALSIAAPALVCMALASCGGGTASVPASAAAPPPPAAPAPPAPTQLDTAAVLGIVRTQTSDTAEPFQVDDSAVEVIPVFDETGAPISVDGA